MISSPSLWKTAFSRMRRSNGFTLVEMLVVIAVIGVLAGILMPAVQAARGSMRRAQCANNLRQLGLGMHQFENTHKALPLRYSIPGGSPDFAWWCWPASMLPQIDQVALNDTCDFKLRPPRGPNPSAVQTALSVFRCPSEPGPRSLELTIYLATSSSFPESTVILPLGNYGMNKQIVPSYANSAEDYSIPPSGRITWADINDGLSNTILLGELITREWPIEGAPDFRFIRGANWSSWAIGYDAQGEGFTDPSVYCQDILSPSDGTNYGDELCSYHPGGAQITLCDGNVRFLSVTIDRSILRRLADPRDGQPVGDF